MQKAYPERFFLQILSKLFCNLSELLYLCSLKIDHYTIYYQNSN